MKSLVVLHKTFTMLIKNYKFPQKLDFKLIDIKFKKYLKIKKLNNLFKKVKQNNIALICTYQ